MSTPSTAPTDGTRQIDVRRPDARVLRVHDDGEPGDDRVPLVLHHGTPQSGLVLRAQLEDARQRGLRVVAYDRPGYGGSDRSPGRSVADAADDVARIADVLGFERFVTSGSSGGGPHALACAVRLPDRVAAVATVAGVAPHDAGGLDWTAGMGDDNVVEFGAAVAGEEALEPVLANGRTMVVGSTPETLMDGMATLLPPADVAALRAGLGRWLHESMSAGLATSYDGWMDDDLAFVRDWGFDLADLHAPALVLAGGADLMVPVAHGEWLAAHLPGAERLVDAEAGHLSLMGDPARAHAWLLSRW